MKFRNIISNVSGFLLILFLIYLTSCDSKGGRINPTEPPPPPPNPYGAGNGKITFYRTQQLTGSVIIKIASKQMTDTIVWSLAPNCDTNIAASQILKAGNYSSTIEADVFLCHYDFTVEERKCTLLNYTNCNGGYVGCTDITGTWLRTADAECPHCTGLKIFFSEGYGEVIYTPPGCRFPLGDSKWINFNINDCTMSDLARDQYGGSPEYYSSTLSFSDKNTMTINGNNVQIPYSRISQTNDKHNYKNIITVDTCSSHKPGLQISR